MPSASRGSDAWRENVSEGKRRGAEERTRRGHLLRVMPSDIHSAMRDDVRPDLQQLLPDAAAVYSELMVAKGAEVDAFGAVVDDATVTPQVRLLIENVVRLTAVIGLAFLRTIQKPNDLEAMGKLNSAITAQAKLLGQIGLDRFERELDPRAPVEVVFSGEKAE